MAKNIFLGLNSIMLKKEKPSLNLMVYIFLVSHFFFILICESNDYVNNKKRLMKGSTYTVYLYTALHDFTTPKHTAFSHIPIKTRKQ